MCGIAGELRFDGAMPTRMTIERMTARLACRGPDGEGFWSSGPVAFGHRRLAIIDLSPLSNQPMVDAAADLALVFNGTIYNYPVLRHELIQRGHAFFSDGDTEVILRAYAEWGESCVEHLDGMFAFALWDGVRQALFLARDRIGIKPLYFTRTRNFFRFASNTQALLAAGGIDTAIDPVSLTHQFMLHGVVPPPFTILKGIRKLEQGTTLTIDVAGRIKERRYWTLSKERPAAPKSADEWRDAIRAALSHAVKTHLDIADVKVGVLLSGGLDSSLLVALAVEQGAADLMTFSVGFEDYRGEHGEERGNEFEYSDAVAEHFATRHHRYLIPNSEVLRRLPEAVDMMAEPMFSQDAVSFYLLAEQVSRSVKVVLSGQGADEVFAGYAWHARMAAESAPAIERLQRHYFDRDYREYLAMVRARHQVGDVTSALIAAKLDEPGADAFIDRLLRLEATLLVTDDPVKRVDNMTMAWGLEARVPFLDHHLVELAARMPAELKLASGGKHVLKTIARGLVPDAVIDRPKGYFPMPALKYVRGAFLDFMRDILASAACRQRGIYKRAYVAKLLAEPEKHYTRIQGSKLWHLALLEFWLQRHVDGVR